MDNHKSGENLSNEMWFGATGQGKKCFNHHALLHFTLCATKRISSRKIHCSRTNFSATETSLRRIRRAKIVKKGFARRSFFIGRAKGL
ncbi:unnamed protein product [Prunus armeniaca]